MDDMNDELRMTRDSLAREMSGEIVLSDSPEKVIKKWRDIFKISQKMLAEKLDITSSVVSDYESGRRKSPGIKVIRKYVDALLDIDMGRGGKTIRSFSKERGPQASEAVLDIKEFGSGMNVGAFCKGINASLVAGGGKGRTIYGYTLIDSFKAITEFSYQELTRLYGTTTQRALIFTGVETGRTPMVAIKLTNLHPALVVLHGLDVVDDVAKRIADVENIPLAVCRLDGVENIIKHLKKIR